MTKIIRATRCFIHWVDDEWNPLVCLGLDKWFVFPETETLWLEISTTRTRHSYKMEKFKKEGLPDHYFCRVEGVEIEIMTRLYNVLGDTSYLRILYD